MKKIVIPDTGDFRKTTELCMKYNIGVEIDIERPEYCPNAIWRKMTAEYENSIEWLIENKFIK
jgi:hypothetical protein